MLFYHFFSRPEHIFKIKCNSWQTKKIYRARTALSKSIFHSPQMWQMNMAIYHILRVDIFYIIKKFLKIIKDTS